MHIQYTTEGETCFGYTLVIRKHTMKCIVMQCGETITYAHDTLLRIIRSVCLCVVAARPALRTTAGSLAATWRVYLTMVEL